MMNMQTFGRNLAEALGERGLAMLRHTSADDVRRVMNGQVPASLLSTPERSVLGGVVVALGAFAAGAAIGAGITALYTPTSGDELRKKLGRGAIDARKQAMQLGDGVRERLDGARASIVHGVEQVTTAVGLASPAPTGARRRKSTKAHAMNGHAPSRAKKSTRAHHHA